MRWIVVVTVLLAGLAVADELPGQLPAKHAQELHRLLAREPQAQKVLVPKTCTFEKNAGGSSVYLCKARGCRGACRVFEATAEVRLRGNALSVRSVIVADKGDTGECGCCM